MNEMRRQVESVLDELEVFFGDATDAEATVYVYYSMREYLPDGVDLVASVTGPTCAYARTLQARIPLRDQGPGPFSLAEARVPDPCFWTPDAPYLYVVEVKAIRDEQVIAIEKRTLAIRRLGVVGRSFYLDAQRWVPRAASSNSPSTAMLQSCHDQSLAMVVNTPTEELCRAATRCGVLLIPRLPADHEVELRTQLLQIERHGAVGMVIVEGSREVGGDGKSIGRNVLGCHQVCDNDQGRVPDWADALVYRIDDPRRAAQFANDCERPVIAWRPSDPMAGAAEARVACDLLQRELAPHGDFAGYFV